MSILTGNNPFYNLRENSISLKIDGNKAETGEEEKKKKPGEEDTGPKDDKGVEINDDSPDANGDGEVNAEDDLNGDGVVDAKDLKIAELQKDLQVRQLEKSLEDLDDPAPEPDQIVANRLRIKDKGDKFVLVDHRGNEVKEFPYNNKDTSSKEARYEAQRYVEKDYDSQILAKHTAEGDKEKAEEKEAEMEGDAQEVGMDKDGDGKPEAPADKDKSADKKDKKKPVKESVLASVSELTDDTKIASIREFMEIVKEDSLSEELFLEGLSLVLEAGYCDFPRTKAEWNKRLPNLARDMKGIPASRGQSVGLATDKEIKALASKEMSVNKPGDPKVSNTRKRRIAMQEQLVAEKKIDAKTMKMLKGLDADEARLIIQGLPRNTRKEVMASLGIKEKVDGRTRAYKETATRLLRGKKEQDLEEDHAMKIGANNYPAEYLEKKLDAIKLALSGFLQMADPSVDNKLLDAIRISLNEALDLEREMFLWSVINEAKDEAKKKEKEAPEAEEKDGADDAGEKQALAALDAAKKELKTKYGYSDDDLGGSSSGKEEGGKSDDKAKAPKGDDKAAAKGDKPAAGGKDEGGDDKAPASSKDEEGEAKKEVADAKAADAEAKEAEMDAAAAEGDAEAAEAGIPDEEGDGVEDINGDGMNDAEEIEDAEDEAQQGDMAAKLDQLQATVDQIAAEIDGEGEEPQVRKGVGPSGKEEYDVVQGTKTVANGFTSAEEALTWIERNRESIMMGDEEEALEGEEEAIEGEMGATEGEEDMVAGDGNKIKAVTGKSSKPIPGKKPTPNDGKVTPSKPDEKKAVKESTQFYADAITALGEAWYGTRKSKTSTVKKSGGKDDGLSGKIQKHQKANPGTGTLRSKYIAKGLIKADMDKEEEEQVTEISKKLAGRYLKKSQIDSVDAGQDMGRGGMGQAGASADVKKGYQKQQSKGIKKAMRRTSGTKNAVNKLTGNARVNAREDRQATVAEIYAAALDKLNPKK